MSTAPPCMTKPRCRSAASRRPAMAASAARPASMPSPNCAGSPSRPSRATIRFEKEFAMTKTVAFDVENRIAWVRFNRPEKRNCMSPTLNREMMEVLNELEFRDDVGVLVLSGEGDAWSAGMDLKEYFRETEAKGQGAVRQVQREAYGWWRRLRWYQKPTIAMVNGWCFGGGYGPLFACDLAFASEEAQFGLSEINWGILPGGGATKVAHELLSFRHAMYHALMGENIDGRKAAEWGLVNEALPLAKLRARVEEV